MSCSGIRSQVAPRPKRLQNCPGMVAAFGKRPSYICRRMRKSTMLRTTQSANAKSFSMKDTHKVSTIREIAPHSPTQSRTVKNVCSRNRLAPASQLTTFSQGSPSQGRDSITCTSEGSSTLLRSTELKMGVKPWLHIFLAAWGLSGSGPWSGLTEVLY